MANQGLKYNVNIVMCIDCTGSMGGLLDSVKANALKFYPNLREACAKADRFAIDAYSYMKNSIRSAVYMLAELTFRNQNSA